MTDFSRIDYTHAKEKFNKMLNRAEVLNNRNNELLSELLTVELHKKVGLETYEIIQREKNATKEIEAITNELNGIANDMRFMRRMTELNLPINFN